jgi:uroporphyrinogen decarboxylase
MGDYEYPMPRGVDVIETPADLQKLTPLDVTQDPIRKQLKTLEIIAREMKGTALFIDTVFDAWNIFRRSLLKEALPTVMAEHPGALEEAITIVNRNLIRYALASLELGAAGVFYAVQASAESMTREQYERFVRPYNLEFFEAIAGKGECHILHAHGDQVYFDRLLDYPVHVLSWDNISGPSISEMRRRTPLTLMAGLDHKKFHALSAKALREQAKAARAQAGNTKFILTPGCAVETWTQAPFIRAAREAARA